MKTHHCAVSAFMTTQEAKVSEIPPHENEIRQSVAPSFVHHRRKLAPIRSSTPREQGRIPKIQLDPISIVAIYIIQKKDSHDTIIL